MGRHRNLSEQEKELISYIYQNTRSSMGRIADTLEYHINTINNYKNYKPIKKKKISKPVEPKEPVKKVFTYRPDLEKKASIDETPDRTELEEEAFRLKMKRKQQE